MDICLNTFFLRIIYLVKVAINLIKFVIPIALIIKTAIDLYKNMINSNNETLPNIGKRLLAAIIVFLVPTIIDLVMSSLVKNYKESNNVITTCYEFANLEYIKTLEEEKATEELELYLSEKEKALDEASKRAAAIRKIVESNNVKAEVGEYANNKNKIKCGTGSQYNIGLFNAVRAAGYKTREGVVAAALYVSSYINVHIPYFWSGGHFHTYDGYKDSGDNFIGIPDKWGCNVKMMGPGTDVQKPNQRYPFGTDCSGFIAWAIYNGGYYTGNTGQKLIISTDTPGVISGAGSGSQPETMSFSKAKGKMKPGDIVYKSGHVGLIVQIENNTVYIAEEKGAAYGLIISKTKMGSGSYSHVLLMDKFYENYQKNKPLYIGFS